MGRADRVDTGRNHPSRPPPESAPGTEKAVAPLSLRRGECTLSLTRLIRRRLPVGEAASDR